MFLICIMQKGIARYQPILKSQAAWMTPIRREHEGGGEKKKLVSTGIESWKKLAEPEKLVFEIILYSI